MTLVCAPAGSGKTILLGSWAAEADEAVAWVTVERGEHDAQRFWLSLIDALADAAGDEVIVGWSRRAAVAMSSRQPCIRWRQESKDSRRGLCAARRYG